MEEMSGIRNLCEEGGGEERGYEEAGYGGVGEAGGVHWYW